MRTQVTGQGRFTTDQFYTAACRMLVKARLVLVLLAMATAVCVAGVPPALIEWQAPLVSIAGQMHLTNHETGVSGQFGFRSWYFRSEEVHVLESPDAHNKVRLVGYKNENNPLAVSLWSAGETQLLGQTLARWGGKNFSYGTLLILSPLNSLQTVTNLLRGAHGAVVSRSEASSDGREGTVTLMNMGKVQRLTDGTEFREDGLKEIVYERDAIVYVDNLISIHDFREGKEISRHSQGTSRFSDYSPEFPAIPRRIHKTVCFVAHKTVFDLRWDVEHISVIPAGVTPLQVLRKETVGLTPNRWPARSDEPASLMRLVMERTPWRWVLVLAIGVLMALAAVGVWLRRTRQLVR